MSVNIFPCRGCPLREGCELRPQLAVRASGLGARSIAFPCPTLAAEVRIGRRVVIRTPVPHDRYCGPDSCGYEVDKIEVPATITATRNHYRFACVIDPGAVVIAPEIIKDWPEAWKDKYRFRKTQAHTRIVRFLDEPDGTLCDHGGRVQRDGVCDHGEFECHCAVTAQVMREFDALTPFDPDRDTYSPGQHRLVDEEYPW